MKRLSQLNVVCSRAFEAIFHVADVFKINEDGALTVRGNGEEVSRTNRMITLWLQIVIIAPSSFRLSLRAKKTRGSEIHSMQSIPAQM